MNALGYVLMWDHLRYGERRRKVLATSASEARKVAALARIWNRMRALYADAANL